MKPKKQVRQMVSVDALPPDVRDAVLRANGLPVRIVLPKYDRYGPNWLKRSKRERSVL